MGWNERVIAALETMSAKTNLDSSNLAALLELFQGLVSAGRLKTDGEFTIEELGTLIIEQIKIKNAAGDIVNPANVENQELLISALADIAATSGMFTIVNQGRTQCAAGPVEIPLDTETDCTYFLFWLDPLSSSVQVDSEGAVADGDEPMYDAGMAPRVIKLATPAKSITVYFAGETGWLNWKAGNPT